jgi:hypothetical protein
MLMREILRFLSRGSPAAKKRDDRVDANKIGGSSIAYTPATSA